MITPRQRFEILKRDGSACRYCGRCPPEVTLDVDHVIPRALGGLDDRENLVAACRECNAGKSAIPLTEAAPIKRVLKAQALLDPFPLPDGPEDTIRIPLAEFLEHRQEQPIAPLTAFIDVMALAVEQGNGATGDVVLRPKELVVRWKRGRHWIHRYVRDLISRQFFESVQVTSEGTVGRIAHWDQRYEQPEAQH